MLIEDWMHRKAEENAHNEILAFLVMILGANLLVGGLLTIIIASGEQSWLNFPYTPMQVSPAYFGFALAITGFAILSAGFALAVHYDKRRNWYIKEIEKSSVIPKLKPKTVDQILEEYVGKKRKENG
ncbi:MAG: hypothetical protein QW270_07065 [Candidatus Bathyarchaeia archaeon]